MEWGGGGGLTTRPAPPLDMDALGPAICKWAIYHGATFGEYDNIHRSQAASGPGLASNYELLKILVGISPTMEYTPSALKVGFVDAVRKQPKLNTTQYNNTSWANLKAERIITMCNHCRRLARDTDRWRVAASKCTGEQLSKLKEVIDSVQCESLFGSPSASSISEDTSNKRHLKRHESAVSTASNVSVDSEGFPNILKDYGGAEKDDNTELFQHKPVKTPALKKMTDASTSSTTCESSGCFYLKDGRKLRITRGTLQSYIHLDQDFLVAISSNMADKVQNTHT